MLNVHRSELGYMEWQRAVEAIVNGCVLLSEHSLGFEPLIPGEHFASVSFDSLDTALIGLIDDEDRLERMRQSAYAFLRDEYPITRSIEALAESVAEVARLPINSSGLRARRDIRPRPKPVDPPVTEYDRILGQRTDLDIVRMGIKQLMLAQRDMRRMLLELNTTVTSGKAGQDTVEHYGQPRVSSPRVSVIITVFNYASLVGSAIRSVAASDFTDYEIVIIDDASTDDSGSSIRTALRAVPWVAATVVTRSRNQGLASARNLGVEMAQGEFVFILDADNMVYPNALGTLTSALDDNEDAAFAYGIIEQLGMNGPSTLMSYLEWDPARLRYGNFIDAMAMMRRSALLEVGGYLSDSRVYGWEDFALWCAFADKGLRGVRAPEVVARYRMALHSMIALTNLDTSAVWSFLVDKYACLSASASSSEPEAVA
jgi:Glycosyl transferase family 2